MSEVKLLLLFHIGENLYAIDTNRIVEIVPMAVLRTIQPASDLISGVLNYQGRVVPIVDLCRQLSGEPCQLRYSTRIIIVNTKLDSKQFHSSDSRQLGFIAEQVTETLKVSIDDEQATELADHSLYIGGMFLTEKGMVQLMNLENLVSDVLSAFSTNGRKLKSAELN